MIGRFSKIRVIYDSIYKKSDITERVHLSDTEREFSSNFNRKNECHFEELILTSIERYIYMRDYETGLNLASILLVNNSFNKFQTSKLFCLTAICYNFFDKTNLAEEYFTKAYDTGNFNQKINSCYTLAMLFLRHHPLELHNNNKGVNYLNKALKIIKENPKVKDSNFNLVFNRNGFALYLYKEGDIIAALKQLEWCIENLEDKESKSNFLHLSVLYYNMFQCYKRINDSKEEIRVLKKLIDLDPEFFPYQFELCLSYFSIENFDTPVLILNDIISKDKLNFKAYTYRGFLNYNKSGFEACYLDYKKSFSLYRNHSSLYNLVFLLRKQKKYLKILTLIKPIYLDDSEYGVELLVLKIETLLNTGSALPAKKILITYIKQFGSSERLYKVGEKIDYQIRQLLPLTLETN